MRTFIILAVFSSLTLHCSEELKTIKSFFETPVIDPCDPQVNLYINDKHYIDREYLKEDGRIDYQKWFENMSPESSDCNPVHKKSKNMPLN